MARTAPMLGSMIAYLGNAKPGEDKKRVTKPKTPKSAMKGKANRKAHTVTRGEHSVTQHGQQHGELESYKAPTQHALMKESARGAMKNATDDWVRGTITSEEHNAVHRRGKHVLAGKHPREFDGPSGERKFR
jgi:hypothetical protein